MVSLMTDGVRRAASQPAFLAGGGETGVLMRAHDWSATQLRSPEDWPPALQSTVGLVLTSGFPMFVVWGEDLTFFYNDAYAEIIGAKHPAALGASFREVWSQIWSDLAPLVEAAFNGEALFYENLPFVVNRHSLDEEAFFTFSYSPMRNEQGHVAGMFCAVAETTKAVLAERRLTSEREGLARLFEQAPGFITTLKGPQHVFEFANAAYRRLIDERSHLGRTVREVFPELEGQGFYELLDQVYATGDRFVAHAIPIRLEPPRAPPEERFLNFIYEPITDETGQVTGIFVEGYDVTEQTRAQEALRQSETALRELNDTLESQVEERTAQLRRHRDIVQSDRSLIVAFDKDYRVTVFNQAHSDEFFRVFGRNAQLGEVLPDLFPPDQALVLRDFLDRALTGESFTVIQEFGDPERAQPPFEISYYPLEDEAGRIIGAFHHARNISDRLRADAELAKAQEALRQSQKMEAVGQLTGGLAHDFNNLLAGISGSLELMAKRIGQGRIGDVERYMTAAQSASRRAAALTHRLLAFSRRQTLDPKPADVARLVSGLEELIRRTVGPSIAVETVGPPDPWPALVDASQLENALLNLCLNARDAMPEGGRLTMKTTNVRLDKKAARERDLAPGQYVSLCVTDTGTGMSPEVLTKAFEPFFTTKPTGEGTGLGLSMVYGFAKQSGGQVDITSAVEQGTTVRVYLPRHRGATEAREASQEDGSAEAMARPSPGQGETVLLVEDEPTVRMLIADILDDLGYSAIEASDSMAGLKVLQSDVRIDLLVTDVGLPGGMNGRQMAEAGRVSRPDLKVLFVTGYAENSLLRHGQLPPGMEVQTKPFEVEAMATHIREMIRAG
jgi:signal transduction histidine kinase/CheY-like chemotaxis protein